MQYGGKGIRILIAASILALVFMIYGNPVVSMASKPGDTIEYTVTLKGMYPNSKSAGISFEFDENVLEFTGGTWTLPDIMVSDMDAAKAKGVVLLKKVTTVMGEVAKVTFRVKEGAPETTSEVKGAIYFMDESNKPQTIESFVLGTVTVDGEKTVPTEAPTTEAPTMDPEDETLETFEPYTGTDTEPSAIETGSGAEDLPDPVTKEPTEEASSPEEASSEENPPVIEPTSGDSDPGTRVGLPIPAYVGIGIAILIVIALIVILIVRKKGKKQ
ncbi:MAG: hypothetical protein IK088_00480 [Lachnospiraceae bacterium]|nr:hypothetical protein [Lachnospiraceae bacterium]